MKLTDLSKIGEKTATRLYANEIYTPDDLLLFFPKKYNIYEIDNQNIFSGDVICFSCIIDSKPAFIKYRRNVNSIIFYAIANFQRIKCIIFSGDYLKFKIQKGMQVTCYGRYKKENKEFVLQNIFFDSFKCKIDVDYNIKDINNKIIQGAIKSALLQGYTIDETLPSYLIDKYRLLSMNQLLEKAHFPSVKEDCIQVRRRRRYEDFFWYNCSLEALRLFRGFEQKYPKFYNEEYVDNIIDNLPYSLTIDQTKAINQILTDLSSPKMMNRLIQGDVGCGKSIVSFIACFANFTAGYQSAIMAPTEILAYQHYENFKKIFDDTDIQVALLTSSTKAKEKTEILYKLLHGRIDVIIGTHSLIQDPVLFQKLGLVVIDEQHRFGVVQRKKLIEKFKGVDALYLTATPIPRTLGLASFGDLDLTSIKTMPAYRKPVITKLVLEEELNMLGVTLRKHLLRGEQVYIVVPLIQESQNLDYIDIDEAYDMFVNLLPDVRIEKLHGKMKSADKKELMTAFKNHDIDCLISTTVIEVGVDVKNATVMVILDADRYGLSQIHQLRGRVGRGDIQSYCYLVSKKEYVKRLDILANTNDGFVLAEEDLKLRGPGDFLGEEQSGFLAIDFDSASNDAVIWKCAMEDSKEFVPLFLNGNIKNDKMEEIINTTKLKKAKIN